MSAQASKDSSGFLSAGAAIGGGSSCTDYDVFIAGMTTKVYATAESAAGIGSGEDGSKGTVTIMGGTVYATSNGTGVCIGGAYGSDECTVNIAGGTVYAGLFKKGGQTDGAGIGGGEGGSGGTITIDGGTVYAMSAFGGAGIGGGYGGAGGVVAIAGGDVVAWSAQEGNGQAIGRGDMGVDKGELTIDYFASVLAGNDEGDARYAVVSANSDGRIDACGNPWARIRPCDHKGAGTYPVPSPDHMSLELHCAHCSETVGQHVHHFACEPVEGDESSCRVWCTLDEDCPYGSDHPSHVLIMAEDTTYDAASHGAVTMVTGPIPPDLVDTNITYVSATKEHPAEDDLAPVYAGTYKAVAKVTLEGSNGVSTISTTYAIDRRPALVRPHDQTVLRGHAIRQDASLVALSPIKDVRPSGPVPGERITSVVLTPTGPLEESCDIEAGEVQIFDPILDVTANYDLRYETGRATVVDTIPDFTAPKALLGLVFDGTEQGLVAPGTVN